MVDRHPHRLDIRDVGDGIPFDAHVVHAVSVATTATLAPCSSG
jgi:hypothetical protein